MKKKSTTQTLNYKSNGLQSNMSLVNNVFSENSEMNGIFKMMDKLLHWAAIIESSDDAIISKSIDGYITSWNRGAERLYGYTAEEVIGQPVSMLMPPSRKNDFPKIMKLLHEGKRVEHYETKRITKDGRVIDVSITVSPIRNSQGNIIGASKIARDITERIENEKRRDEFVSTASHELKTPITSQKVFGELLERLIDKNGYEDLKPIIRKMNNQTEKLTKLVEDLLDLSRIQTARISMDKSEFPLDTLVHDVVEDMRLTTNHAFTIKGATKKIITGDRERISQVLTNLLSNAVKYSPKADKIVVTLKGNRNEVLIAVQDFGIGINEAYFDKIFERFFRVSGNDEKTFPGMGIGLHLSKEIISKHGGKIWVESKKGNGSTFYFTLPIHT